MANVSDIRTTDGNVASIEAFDEAGNRGDDHQQGQEQVQIVDDGTPRVHTFPQHYPNRSQEQPAIEGPGGSLSSGGEQRYDADSDMMLSYPELLRRLRHHDPEFPGNQARQYFAALPREAPMLDSAAPAIPLRSTDQHGDQHERPGDEITPFQQPPLVVNVPAIQQLEGREPHRLHHHRTLLLQPPRQALQPPLQPVSRITTVRARSAEGSK